jgi:Asp-tRNA(Asn)/Glu-tRNA(Gln) amidotransferase A subunit family amidase
MMALFELSARRAADALRKGEQTAEALAEALLARCAAAAPLNAFTVMLNGVPVSTLSTFIRNLAPGSAAGIPGLSLPAGMTKAGLPVGMQSTRRRKATTSFWRLGLLSKPCCPGCRRRRLDRSRSLARA